MTSDFFLYEDSYCLVVMTSVSTIVCIDACPEDSRTSYDVLYVFDEIDFDEVNYWIDEAD